jgi:3,4-dihydroxy 2-butanone 4-phosphate synthase/GTP cyclohydrolase II
MTTVSTHLSTAEPEEFPLDPIPQAVDEIARGRAVIVVDDPGRENEGDLIIAGSRATEDLVGFMIRHTSGVICVPMVGPDLDRLRLPPMTAVNEDPKRTAYTVSVDARHGVTTGISAHDRANTIRVLADSATQSDDLTRPGHIFPLRTTEGGVLRRPGHTEAAVDLARLAGLPQAAAIGEIVHDNGSCMRLPNLVPFARQHRLTIISIVDLIRYRRRTEKHVERAAQASLPTPYGEFRAIGYRSTVDGSEHVALVMGEVGDGQDVLVRLHSECLTGDVLDSLRCDCGPQLRAALQRIAAEGRGIALYARGHEGRGIGLLAKLRAYELQEQGHDTVDANLALGLPADARDYGTSAQIFTDLGVRSMRLLTNNPAKIIALEELGLAVTGRVSLQISPNSLNGRYLRTKRDRMGHHLDLVDHLATHQGNGSQPRRAAPAATRIGGGDG